MKAVQAGQPPTAVARALGLYPARVFVWLAAYRAGGWDAASRAQGERASEAVDGVLPVAMDLQYRDIEKSASAATLSLRSGRER